MVSFTQQGGNPGKLGVTRDLACCCFVVGMFAETLDLVPGVMTEPGLEVVDGALDFVFDFSERLVDSLEKFHFGMILDVVRQVKNFLVNHRNLRCLNS